jgi:small GTP-binding protein
MNHHKRESESITFAGVAGEDHWIEHEVVETENGGRPERPSITSTAGRSVFARDYDPSNNFTFKVVLLGDAYVGKSSIANLYIKRQVLQLTQSTIAFDSKFKHLLVDGVPSTVQLWDTAGMEQYRSGLINQYYRNVDGVIFVYDITDRVSFNNIEDWLQEMKQYCRDSERVQKLLIGNKRDREVERDVTEDEGKIFANHHRMLFMEFTAQSEDSLSSLDAMIDRLAELMLGKREETSLTRSMQSVIRLNPHEDEVNEDGWTVINEYPQGPFPLNDNRRRGIDRQELSESVRNVLRRPSITWNSFRHQRPTNTNGRCSC